MKVLKPEIDKLNEKNKGQDPMKAQQATMNLYRRAGVNPLEDVFMCYYNFLY